ncbi:transcriptional regulator [Brevundimonas sp. S30B]|uniref:PTS sugar transporter subunit IIA n=1 Tax=unclassified Brevundimonas TaxID=2622653 RepID=UPI00107179EC|nr:MULTISPECIES: PTS sugar transporter subunit IIA [unclassified Brevundimonas]QBX38839.1 transcriptional regulator [Brevundimonas sp. MF30-B]TFW00929.1 transcriptional regulator [Brevundimonas sp. S30B]
MDIGNLLAADGVLLRGSASSKRQALHLVAEAASHALGIDEAKAYVALAERESLGSTGLGAGVAVPHARIEGLDRVWAVLVRLETPAPFDALDDRPVDLLMGLFGPPDAGAEHLRALAAVSRALRAPAFRERLRQARTADAVRAVFVEETTQTAA